MTKPAINDTAVCKDMARRLLKISLTPAVKNILQLINMPSHVPPARGLNDQLHPLPELELNQTIVAYSDEIDAEALKIDATARRKYAESTDDFSMRSAYLLSNLFNAYVIPTYLIHTLEEVGNFGTSTIPAWSSMIHVSYSVYEGNLLVRRHTLNTDQLLLLDNKTVDGRRTEFFVAAGEYLRREITDIVTCMEPRRPSKLVLSVSLAPEFITDMTVKHVETSVPALETLARALQLLPIYRSLLSASTNDFGITNAPYYLGVGCSSINYVEMCSSALKQKPRPVKRHKMQACIYLYGSQDHILPLSSFDIATQHMRMSMLSLYEIELDKDKAHVLAETILPFECSSRKEIPHSATLEPFFHARGIKTQSPLVEHNKCTVLDIRINPARTPGKKVSAKMLSSYLHLIVNSSKNLFGLGHRALAYISTVQDMDKSKNVTVLHVLDMGTPPYPGSPYNVCDSVDLIAYDEAAYNAQRGRNTTATHNAKKGSIYAVASVLEATFASANKRFSESFINTITRSAGFSTNIDAFLSSGTAQCTIIIQDTQHIPYHPMAPLYEEVASVSDSMGDAPSITASCHSPMISTATASPQSGHCLTPSVAGIRNVGRPHYTVTGLGFIPTIDDQSDYVQCTSSAPSASPLPSPSLPRAVSASCPHMHERRRCLSASPQVLHRTAQQIIENEVSLAQQSCHAEPIAETMEPGTPTVESCVEQRDTALAPTASPAPDSTSVTIPDSMVYLQVSPDDVAIQRYNKTRTVPNRIGCKTACAISFSCIALFSLTTVSYAFFWRRVIDVAIVQRCDAIFVAGISLAMVMSMAIAVTVDRRWNHASRQPLVDTLTEHTDTGCPSNDLSAPAPCEAIDSNMSCAR
ncbi:hypothetical protein [Candidatus Anaplasma sp. TIGMIC]|uniref:hypothetical protein n=1 Tax=Candidatus Anaplasma sp. TIGMIC TaxID=3020713 RepID=UPI002330569F|nr:hypothetical protein [Candidatus Anaplasma sp. TIGMIC]MDB1135294.1 hypothetical protein [Candidatus Anaplasma sp. TIGMIC]